MASRYTDIKIKPMKAEEFPDDLLALAIEDQSREVLEGQMAKLLIAREPMLAQYAFELEERVSGAMQRVGEIMEISPDARKKLDSGIKSWLEKMPARDIQRIADRSHLMDDQDPKLEAYSIAKMELCRIAREQLESRIN